MKSTGAVLTRKNGLDKLSIEPIQFIKNLLELIPWGQQQNIQPVKKVPTKKYFVLNITLGLIKLPISDTCKTCDETKIKLDIADNNKDP